MSIQPDCAGPGAESDRQSSGRHIHTPSQPETKTGRRREERWDGQGRRGGGEEGETWQKGRRGRRGSRERADGGKSPETVDQESGRADEPASPQQRRVNTTLAGGVSSQLSRVLPSRRGRTSGRRTETTAGGGCGSGATAATKTAHRRAFVARRPCSDRPDCRRREAPLPPATVDAGRVSELSLAAATVVECCRCREPVDPRKAPLGM